VNGSFSKPSKGEDLTLFMSQSDFKKWTVEIAMIGALAFGIMAARITLLGTMTNHRLMYQPNQISLGIIKRRPGRHQQRQPRSRNRLAIA
jgi:hypothetical protein